MIGFVVFLAGFRQVIKQARPDHEWVASLVFGAGLVVITLELAGDALQGAAAGNARDLVLGRERLDDGREATASGVGSDLGRGDRADLRLQTIGQRDHPLLQPPDLAGEEQAQPAPGRCKRCHRRCAPRWGCRFPSLKYLPLRQAS